MKRLKLIQGLSYAVRGFSCALGVSFDVEDDFAKKLLSTRRFEELPCVPDDDDIEDETENTLLGWLDSFDKNEDILGNVMPDMDSAKTNGIDMAPDMDNAEKTGTVSDDDKKFSERELSADGIAKMKKAELEALAAEKQIDISDCGNNGERVSKICGVLGLASTVQMGLEN